ncbi:hypothetical protein AK830_g12068 [Neonectria ditissima]|uniref:Extracellular membrane protein CFEM domain-containing protein n=1 Tax=Neonectria ditissima TaxID=78410 RepID=A0A0P7B409_9HYPO|nr:hypothetical protein AK830_g12068 [Neonectria ditissima]
MRVSSVLAFAGSVLAKSVSLHDCLVDNSQDLAAFADCGHQGALAKCLAQLQSFLEPDVRACYTSVGCSGADAEREARFALNRCADMASMGDLKKRFRAADDGLLLPRADATTTADDAKTTAASGSKTGSIYSGTDCFTTGTKSTSDCPLSTSSGHVKTLTCTSTVVTTSSCAETLICTTDSANNDICMDLHHMDVGGIIVSIVFAAALVIGAAALTWACCKDRKEQKRMVAKAEATALVRAATKKQRAAQRAPLIRNASGGSNPNPFQDQNRL